MAPKIFLNTLLSENRKRILITSVMLSYLFSRIDISGVKKLHFITSKVTCCIIYIVLFFHFVCIIFQFQATMEPPIPLKGVVLFISFGSMVSAVI